MCKGRFVRDVQRVECVFQWLVVGGFVVVHIDNVGRLYLGAIKCVVLVELVLSDGCKVYSDGSV